MKVTTLQQNGKNPHHGIWMFLKIVGFPLKSSHFDRDFHYKPSILVVPLFLETPIYHNTPINNPPPKKKQIHQATNQMQLAV